MKDPVDIRKLLDRWDTERNEYKYRIRAGIYLSNYIKDWCGYLTWDDRAHIIFNALVWCVVQEHQTPNTKDDLQLRRDIEKLFDKAKKNIYGLLKT